MRERGGGVFVCVCVCVCVCEREREREETLKPVWQVYFENESSHERKDGVTSKTHKWSKTILCNFKSFCAIFNFFVQF